MTALFILSPLQVGVKDIHCVLFFFVNNVLKIFFEYGQGTGTVIQKLQSIVNLFCIFRCDSKFFKESKDIVLGVKKIIKAEQKTVGLRRVRAEKHPANFIDTVSYNVLMLF